MNKQKLVEAEKSAFIEKAKGHTYWQWASAIIAANTVLCNGLDSGWMAPVTKTLQSEDTPLGEPLSETMLSWTASVISFGASLSVPLYSYIADRFGRKPAATAIAVPQVVGWTLRYVFKSPIILLISRILTGISAGGCYSIVPIYIKEISQNDIRGTLGSIMTFSENVGILIMYIIGAYLDYYMILRIVIFFPILTLLLLLKAPETPSYLIKLNKIEEATETLAFLRGKSIHDKAIEAEIAEMKYEQDYFRSLPGLSLTTIFKNRVWREGILIVAVLLSLQAMNGTFSIIIFSHTILSATGAEFNITSETLSLVVPIVLLAGSVIALVIIDRFPRKVLTASLYGISAVSMGGLGACLLAIRLGGSVPSWLPILFMVVAVGTYSGGIVPLPTIVMMEVFNFQIRAKVTGVVLSYSLLMSFLQVFVYGPLSTAFGIYTAFFFFGSLNLFGTFFSILVQPESRGKTVEEIEEALGRRGKGIATTEKVVSP